MKRLNAKASAVHLPPRAVPTDSGAGAPAPVAPASQAPAPGEGRPKTAPGALVNFMATQSTALAEMDTMRRQLQAFDGASVMRSLDPAHIRPSKWANRHEHSFSDDAFAELKADIEACGSNVQPILVRPIADEGGVPRYELVFGHRRHRACLELGLKVQAVIAPLDDRALFEAMERENRARKALSAWEQGAMYLQALESKLYPSQRKLAEGVGVDLSQVSKALALARLPQDVLRAFGSPLVLQYRWAQGLSEALQKDPQKVLAMAREFHDRQPPAAPRAVFEALAGVDASARVLNGSTPAATSSSSALDVGVERFNTLASNPLRIGRKGRAAVLTRSTTGAAVLTMDPGLTTPELCAELAQWMSARLSR